MQMMICPLFSGSSGNCTYVSCGRTSILVDAGKNERQIADALLSIGADAKRISAILITHEHTDHIRALHGLAKKYSIPIYTTYKTWGAILSRGVIPERQRKEIEPGQTVSIGCMKVTAFAIPHDTLNPVGYRIEADGHSCAIATDIGAVLPSWLDVVKGSAAVLMECSYDEEMLTDKPDYYRERMRSGVGHLSNTQCAAVLVDLVHAGTKQICLAHMSAQSNEPAKASRIVCETLNAAGLEAGKDYELSVAERDRPSRKISLEEVANQ